MYNPSSKINEEIDPKDLKKKMDNNDDIFLLDVRTPAEYESWRISYEKHENPKLIPVDHLFGNTSNLLKEIPKDKEIVTICAHGNRSLIAAKLLNQLGYNVKSVRGGMAGWNKVSDIAEVPVSKNAPFQIWQIRRISKGCMGYIISSKEDKTAAIIDPSREIEESFLRIANENKLKITKIIDTHQHADHVSGVAGLMKDKKKDINSENCFAYFSSYEDYDFSKSNLDNIKYIQDGDVIFIGQNVELKAIHTPGHTNGSMSFILEHNYTDNNNINIDNNDTQNSYLFTGDTLFVDGIGRPDLRDQASQSAEMLYDSYHQKILKFPMNTVILPAHFNGTSITLKHAIPISDTIGSIINKVKPLSMPKNEFIKFVTDTLPPRPMNYKTIISINKKMPTDDEMEMPDLEAGPNSCAISS